MIVLVIYLVIAVLFVVGGVFSHYYYGSQMKSLNEFSLIQGAMENSDDFIEDVIPFMALRNSWDGKDDQ